MAPLSRLGRNPVGKLKLGLAGVVLAAALAFLGFRARDLVPNAPARLAVQAPAPASAPARPDWRSGPLPEGPAMRVEPAALAEAGRERDDNGLHMKFRWCPPGSFHLGRLPDAYRGLEGFAPAAVTLREGFWMGRIEVTQAEWRQVMGRTLREQRACDPTQPRPVGDGTTRDHVGEGPDFPIYFTSFDDAEEFCRKLTDAERRAGRLGAGWEYRLPDEAQWEYACRAGTTTATAFGDRLDGTIANIDGTKPFGGAPAGPYLHETTPVGRYPANAWGLHDMHGNVWEWCRDYFETEPSEDTRPVGTAGAAAAPPPVRRTYRGGCWHNPGSMSLSTSRSRMSHDGRGSGLGFRVALVPVGPHEGRGP